MLQQNKELNKFCIYLITLFCVIIMSRSFLMHIGIPPFVIVILLLGKLGCFIVEYDNLIPVYSKIVILWDKWTRYCTSYFPKRFMWYETKQRLGHLDALRGIAALLVGNLN
eukprot:NODE_96_length_20709_cov_1.429161.p18 type:complete len:111 gc:universal NODE_96_length_20709_cov_1.429161:11940-11608(-)